MVGFVVSTYFLITDTGLGTEMRGAILLAEPAAV